MKYLGPPQSGSRADLVASHNRYGQYYRERAIPVNPMSTRQSNIRSQLTAASVFWKTLTAAQKTDWQSYANAHPRSNALGETITLTAQAAFVAANVIRQAQGSAISAGVPLGTESAGYTNITPTWTAGALSIAFTVTPSTNAAGVWATRIVSPGITVGPGPGGWRKIGSIAAGASPSTQTTNWTAFFGTPPAAGQVTFIWVRELVDGLWTPGFVRRVVAT
jgi:hypothetical protein